ncbi:MAG: pilus assembly PilX N-terminal domain-containing protein, partial [Desulfobacterales bacterium]
YESIERSTGMMQGTRGLYRRKSLTINCRHLCTNQRGMALPVALMFLMVLATVATTATIMTTTDLKIAISYRISTQLTAAAETGIEEARGRLRTGAVEETPDTQPGGRGWAIFIGTEAEARLKGYDARRHEDLYSSLQNDMDYIVRIDHQRDAADDVEYYGDIDGDRNNERNSVSGENVYRIESSGYDTSGSYRTIEIEAVKIPPIDPPGAVYLEAYSEIIGDVNINGMDSCGGGDIPGITTPKSSGTVGLYSSPVITGVGGTTPNILYNGDDLYVNGMVAEFKKLADFSYAVNGVYHYPTTSPGPGDDWGTPTPGADPDDPSTCAESNIVYYDTGGSYLVLSNGVSGCGILVVEGDLYIDYDFSWHGVIIATEFVAFYGTGVRNITGAVIARGSVEGNYSGGSTNIVYCSSAVTDQTEGRPLRILSWKE